MKTKIYILLLIFLALMGILNAQTYGDTTLGSNLPAYPASYWEAYAVKLHLNAVEKREFLSAHQKDHLTFIQQQAGSPSPVSRRLKSSQSIFSGGCVNIDFESGNFSGWTSTHGYNPLYAANTSGCCLTSGGQQSITTGPGLDPAGGFPVVCPGGTYSLRLGSSQTGGLADRIEQTFLVTTANANFTYKYAVVLEDPGHVASQQPYFQVDMLDSTGAQIPCTYYSVSANANIPGFQSSTTMSGVIYKPWSSVVADLTGLIGQNVTIRFTTYDCSLGGHFGYAYIDGSCLSFNKTSSDTICAAAQKTYCAPTGFLSTTWNGPGMVNNLNQCINASAPGVYTCQTVLIPGCPGPTFTYTLSNFPHSNLGYNAQSAGACSKQYSFANTSTISHGSIVSYTWSFGTGLASNSVNPAFNYLSAGNYTVKLSAVSDKGCHDSLMQTLVIYPMPAASFSATPTCQGSRVSFSDLSAVSSGSLSAYHWSFGNGQSDSVASPSIIYSNSGNFPVSLTVTSSKACSASYSASLLIYAKPLAAFIASAPNPCATQYSFTNTSSVSTGAISNNYWSFGASASSTLSNPVYGFAGAGTYTTTLIASTSQGCRDTSSQALVIHPAPIASFTAANACEGSAILFSNGSSIAGDSIALYSWGFGNGQSNNLPAPQMTYTSSGTYVVTLTAVSNQGCMTTATNSLTIYPVPVTSIAVSGFCYNSSSSFVNNSSISGGSLSQFTWSFGDGSTASVSSGNHTYSNPGPYNIGFTVTSIQNCIATALSTLTIYPLPSLSFSASNICEGNNTIFSNHSAIASGSIVSYSWSFGNGSSSAQSSPSLTYPGSGSYIVALTATSDQNCVATTTSNVVIYPTPHVSFSANRFCLRDTAVFSSQVSISTGSLSSFNWQFGDGGSAAAQNSTHLYNGPGTYTVSFSAVSDQNCPATNTSVVVIYPLPLINFTGSNICLGDATSFLNNSRVSLDAINNWAWDFGDGGQSLQQAPAHTYVAPGTYTVTLKATSSDNCSNTASSTVSVYASPGASFAVNNVCQGNSSVFENKSSIAAPDQIVSTTWDFGNGSSSQQLAPTVTYSAGGTYSVRLTVSSNRGCSQTYTLPLTIYYLPQVDFSPSYACMNQATQFVNTTTLQSGSMARCRWDFDNDGVWDDTVSTNPIRTYPFHGAYNCRLEVASSYQCLGSKINAVRVYANPVADFTTHAVCLGDVTTFFNKSSSDDGSITSYQWDFNGDNIVDNVRPDPTVTYTANGTYLVKLEVQTQYGCVNVKSMSGRINALPVPGFVSNNNKVCPGQPVSFVNTSSISAGAIVSTQWNFGDGSAPVNTQDPTHLYQPGDYNVSLKLVSDSGCTATSSSPGFVTIYPKPQAGFVVNPEEVDELDPRISVSSDAQNAVFTSYYINDGSVYSTARFDHTFQNLDQKKPVVVQVVANQFNCTDTLIRAIDVKPAFAIYVPNTFTPNGDGLNDGFQAKGVGISKFNMQIFDRWGHLLFESASIENAWDGLIPGSTEPIKQDIYPWKAQVVDIFNKLHDLSGSVALIR